jgi:5-methylthioribose kinase
LEGSVFEAEERWLDHAITYTWATYVGYQSSREVLRRLAGPLRPAVLEALAKALRERNGEAPFEVAYRTRLFLLRPRDPQ